MVMAITILELKNDGTILEAYEYYETEDGIGVSLTAS